MTAAWPRLPSAVRAGSLDLLGDDEWNVLAFALTRPEHAAVIDPEIFRSGMLGPIAPELLRQAVAEDFDLVKLAEESGISLGAVNLRLNTLADMNGTEALPFHFASSLRRLNEAHEWRDIARRFERVHDRMYRGDLRNANPDELRAALDEFLTRLPDSTDAPGTLADTFADPADDTSEAVRTGLPWFDSAMPGGALQRGDKVAISAMPGIGKTALTLQLSLCALQHDPDLRIVYANGEMSEKALRNRALMNLSGLTLEVLRIPWESLSPAQEQAKRQATATLKDIGQRFHIITPPLTAQAVENAVRATGAQLVSIDYLQLMRAQDATQTRRDEIDTILRDLCRIAQVRNVVLIVISNMPKGQGATAKRDLFDAFKESSEIAFAMDLAFVGKRASEPNPTVQVEWDCLKARHGQPTSIVTRFDPAVQRFTGAES